MTHNITEGLMPLATPIDWVEQDSLNARTGHNIKALSDSLIKYGQRKPIVVNKNTNVIEAGNGTYKAAVSLGWDTIAVVYVHDDSETAIGYSIADNRLAELSEWDDVLLDELLEEVGDIFTGFDLDVEEMTPVDDIPLPSKPAFTAPSTPAVDENRVPDEPRESYTPTLAPKISTKEITPEKMESVADKLNQKIKDARPVEPTMCPHCGEEFFV